MGAAFKTIVEKVDRAAKLNDQISKLNSELKLLKQDIMNHAVRYNQKEVNGDIFKVKISPKTVTECDPKDLYDKMEENNALDSFFGLVTVKKTDASKFLGQMLFNNISTQNTEDFGSIKFVKL